MNLAQTIVNAVLEAGDREEIKSCAARLSDGTVLTGPFHGAIFSKAWTDGLFGRNVDEDEEAVEIARKMGRHNGFITNKGRFVGRREGWKIAKRASQVDLGTGPELWHKDFNPQ